MFEKILIPNELLKDEVKQLNKLSPFCLLLVFAPAIVTTIVYWSVWSSTYDIFLVYAFANWVTLAILYLLLRRFGLLREVFLFPRPQRRDWILALAAFIIGVFGAYPIAQVINASLGVPMRMLVFSINKIEYLLTILFYAVITAPFAEEVLFRGLCMGYLIARGVSPFLAGGLALAGFALMHFPPWGLGGVVFILLWGTLPTMLRLRRNSLTPGWLMHAMNNLFAYILLPLALSLT